MKKKSASSHRQKETVPTIRPETSAAPASATFPIVGIGASAGGLEALDQFLGRVPTGSGMAFVIVQHLDPTRKGIMSELLQRATGMKVIEVKDRTTVRPDCVYAKRAPSDHYGAISRPFNACGRRA
jgi:two-component system CheB/CheR fusion protein